MEDIEKIREFTISILQDISERLDKKPAPMTQREPVQPKPLKSIKELYGYGSGFVPLQTEAKGTEVQSENRAKKVITARDIGKIKAGGELVLCREDIVTPLARDMLNDKGIKLLIR